MDADWVVAGLPDTVELIDNAGLPVTDELAVDTGLRDKDELTVADDEAVAENVPEAVCVLAEESDRGGVAVDRLDLVETAEDDADNEDDAV